MAGLFFVILLISIVLVKWPFLKAYSNNADIIHRCNDILHVVFLFILVDCVRGVLKGTTKAMGLY
jgi:Na+-driven multidrug efflux pump